jgi:uncharacterized protein (DUF2062 family)
MLDLLILKQSATEVYLERDVVCSTTNVNVNAPVVSTMIAAILPLAVFCSIGINLCALGFLSSFRERVRERERERDGSSMSQSE